LIPDSSIKGLGELLKDKNLKGINHQEAEVKSLHLVIKKSDGTDRVLVDTSQHQDNAEIVLKHHQSI